jgi:hypothetical protein
LPKLKNIILHIGPDKTGSTAIQRTLSGNNKLFESCGVLYSGGSGQNDIELNLAFSKVRSNARSHTLSCKKKRDHEYLEKLQQRVKTTSAEHLILSHEGLIYLTIPEISMLQKFLMGLSERVTVVLYARDPFSYALSAMSQRVKTGRRAWAYLSPIVKYKDLLERWSVVFGREALEVRLYSRDNFPGGDVVLDFISMPVLKGALNDLDTSNLKCQTEWNPSFSGLGVRVGDRIVEILGTDTPKGRNFRTLFIDELLLLNSGKTELTSIQKKLIRWSTYRQTEYLAQEFNIVFPEFKEPVKQSKLHLEIDIEILARKIIADKLPEFRMGSVRAGWRRLKYWVFDRFFVRGANVL